MLEDAVVRACDVLACEAATGFQEAAHVMRFPRSQGFEVEDDYQVGDIFARATIVDALADARDCGFVGFEGAIRSECDYLIESRRRYAPGGWSYFPALNELPVDADDLAQVMRALLRGGRRDAIDAYCIEPLEALLSAERPHAGAFETWILPQVRETLHERQAWWIANAWGTGVDVEVVANMMHVLAVRDMEQYRPVVESGTAYVADARDTDGLWSGSWYHGRYYPTFACVRLMDEEGRDDVGRAVRASLCESQNADGGWGWAGSSDPLSTALALLTLSFQPPYEAASRARNYLLFQQHKDGGWSNVPWIRMELGRSSGTVQQILSYGSRTIVTAYVLKALLLCMEGVNENGRAKRRSDH